MEQFAIGIIVGLAAYFIFTRFRNYIRAAKFAGGGCCGTCGCRATKEDFDPDISKRTPEEIIQLSKN